jgi:hypothetical protein
METIKFKSSSSLDRGSRKKMLFVAAVVLMVLLPGIILYFKGDLSLLAVNISILALYIVILITGFANKPISYLLSDSMLYIKRYRGILRIALSDIKIIREFNEEDRKGLYRKFGAEGAFGNFGFFASRIHKKLYVYTSRDTNWVLIVTNSGRSIVIAPDNLNLIGKVQEIMKINQGA